jgi:7-cyano-7-deazaguanine synthase
MTKICVFSGGIDSTVLLCQLLANGDDVRAVSIDYGQRHGARELEAASRIAAVEGVPHDVVDVSGLAALLPGSSQTDPSVAVPLGHYADPSMRASIVPNRNMILLSAAAAICLAHGGEAVVYGAHAGDSDVYPDCREVFAGALDVALQLCDHRPVRLERPFVNLTKSDIVKKGVYLGAPLEMTWSCYVGGSVHCGNCGTCFERREAFAANNYDDPTEYSADARDLESFRKPNE